jgi:hypothetical protein
VLSILAIVFDCLPFLSVPLAFLSLLLESIGLVTANGKARRPRVTCRPWQRRAGPAARSESVRIVGRILYVHVGGRVIHPDGRTVVVPAERAGSRGFTASINFAPTGARVRAGSVADTGAVFGDRGNGLLYGWNGPHAVRIVAPHLNKNNAGPDEQRDTFAVMQASGRGSRWQRSRSPTEPIF